MSPHPRGGGGGQVLPHFGGQVLGQAQVARGPRASGEGAVPSQGVEGGEVIRNAP